MESVASPNNSSQTADDCTICLNNLTSRTPVLTLSCTHRFHLQCLALNIQAKNNECPLCRAAIDANVIQLLGNATRSSVQAQTRQAPAVTIVIPSVEDRIDEAVARATSERLVAAINSLNEADNWPLISTLTTLEYEAQVPHEESNIYGLVTLQAPPALQSNNQQMTQLRAPIDLVCIVDQSGSMTGEKIDLLKKTLVDIVDQLNELDRLAIVSFNNNAVDRSHGLKRINQQNQQVLKADIDSITSGGGTYIGAGLQMGIDLIANRQTKNPLAALLVLTDGQDNDFHDYTPILSRLPEGVQCYTFGYGSDHNAELLVKIAEHGNDGTYTYIDEEKAVSTAFAMTLSGLLTCMAQQIEVNIEFNGAYKVTNFHSKYKYEPQQLPSTKLSIRLSNLNADEKRNLVFQLYVPKVSQLTNEQSDVTTEQRLFEKQTIGHVTVSYIDPNTARSITTPHTAFQLIRAPNLPPELLQVNHRLDLQRNRIETINALERAMAELNYFDSCVILATQVEKIKASASAQDPFCQSLIQDLEYSFKSEQAYRSTQYTSYISHATERGTYTPSMTTSSGHYHNPVQQRLLQHYKRNKFS